MTVIDFQFQEQMPVREESARSTGPRKVAEASVRHLITEEYARDWSGLPKAPDVASLGSLGGQRLRVREPFLVTFREEASQIVVGATEFDEFGFGSTKSEALVDLQRAITELYFTLSADADRLGPDLQRVWVELQKKITTAPGHEGTGV